jgi:membrane protein
MTARAWYTVFKDTYRAWSADKAPRLGAAVAYYSVFSVAPLLVIAVAIAGMVFGEQAAQGVLVKQLADTIGRPQAEFLEAMIRSAYGGGSSGVPATVIGLITLLLGASGVFSSLQDALNTIWKVMPKPDRWLWQMIRDRLWSFLLVLVTGLLLLVLLGITILLQVVNALDFLSRAWTEAGLPGVSYLWQIANVVISFAMVTVFFAIIYKILPDVKMLWRDVWAGAVVGGVLFTIGKFLLGLYLGRSGVTSTYGIAGSLVVILIWIYYSAQILLFGAELTRVVTLRHGTRVVPADNAMPMTPAGEPLSRRDT